MSQNNQQSNGFNFNGFNGNNNQGNFGGNQSRSNNFTPAKVFVNVGMKLTNGKTRQVGTLYIHEGDAFGKALLSRLVTTNGNGMEELNNDAVDAFIQSLVFTANMPDSSSPEELTNLFGF